MGVEVRIRGMACKEGIPDIMNTSFDGYVMWTTHENTHYFQGMLALQKARPFVGIVCSPPHIVMEITHRLSVYCTQ